jgi:YD repeat-containing protein
LRARLCAAAAAVLLVGALTASLLRPGPASAASFFQAVRATWTEVPACHIVGSMRFPHLEARVETWYVRGKGGRRETCSAQGLTGVVVSNGRWEYRWDVQGRLVAAWSSALLGDRGEFARAGLVQNSEQLLRWADAHRAEVRIETETLGGRKVRRAMLRWPGPDGDGKGRPQTDTIWFDPDTLRPVKQRSELWDGGVTEAEFDYPSPEQVPADLLTFRPPDDVTLEVNDPDLGRQLYSEARESGTESDPLRTKGDRR